MADIDFTANLTLHQLQMWLAQQRYGKSALYNLTFSFRFSGGVQPDVFARAYRQLTHEADCLRLQIGEDSAEPVLMIGKGSSHSFRICDFSQDPAPQAAFETWMKGWAERPVNFEELVPNSALALVDVQTAYWALTIHHIVADGWGIFLLVQRLKEIYAAYSQGLEPGPTPLVSLRRLVEADAAYRASPDFIDDKAYWDEKLSQMPDALMVYGSGGHGKMAASRRLKAFTAAQPVRDFLQGERATGFLGASPNVSLFNLLLTVFAAYLHRVSGSTSFSVDVALLNRREAGLRQVPGFAVQVAPLIVNLDPKDTFRSLVIKIRREMQALVAHCRYPILNHHDDTQTVSFNLHNRVALAGSSPAETWWYSGVNTDDLSMNILNPDLDQERIELGLDLPLEILQGVQEDQVCAHFIEVLRQCLSDPDLLISQTRLWSEEAARRQLSAWNQTAAEFPLDRGVHHLFEDWAERQPEAAAVYFEDQVLSYGELNARANRLAHLFVKRGLQPGMLVGVCLERSLDLIVTIFGVLKAGGVYVPLDPAYPKDRLADIIQDAALSWVVSTHRTGKRLPHENISPLYWEDIQALLQQAAPENRPVVFSAHDLAYVIFTSGSTGRPKGVMIEHHNLVNYVADIGQNWQVGPGDVGVQISSLNFDSSIEEIFLPLTHGAALVLRNQDFLDSIPNFLSGCQKYGVTLLPTPTGFWHELVTQMEMFDLQPPASLRLVDVGGERLRPSLVAVWLDRTAGKIQLWNGYGPTETTVVSTWYEIEGPAARWRTGEEVPIGRPGKNQTAYVLDANRQPVPAGVMGELYIGGRGVGRGYLNQPELTAERFLPDPFQLNEAARMYRTGDLVRQRPDGILEFWGRADQQVKLRGYRVEPGEIESVLTQHKRVKQALVMLQESRAGDQRLVAYIILNDSKAEESDWRAYLREKLPEFMIPAAIVTLPRIPLTPNGKVDRRALPDPFAPEAADGLRQGPAPRSVLEAQLEVIWKDVLGLSGVTIDQDFFDLGGNSLLGIRLFAEIEKKLNVRLPVAELFHSPTIQKLAETIQTRGSQLAWSPVVLVQAGGPGLPLFIVHGWGGGVLGYAPLAHDLGTRWPIYGLQAAGMLGEQPPDDSVEKMAARYIRAMQTIQPNGPYRLGGYCAGGVIAYEMACLLARQGEEIQLIAMIEGYSPDTLEKPVLISHPRRWAAILKNIPFWLREYREIGFFGVRQRVVKVMRAIEQRRRRALDPRMKFLLDDVVLDEKGVVPDRQMELLRLHLDALSHYHPRPYPGKAVVFVAQGLTVSQALFGSLDATLGWKNLVLEGVKTVYVAGGHRNLHMPPYVHSLAAALRNELQRADEGGATPNEAH